MTNNETQEALEYVEALDCLMRMQRLIGRVERNEPTGVEVARTIQTEAEGAAYRVLQLRSHLEGAGADEFAKAMGWPSAQALREFLTKGAVPSGETVN